MQKLQRRNFGKEYEKTLTIGEGAMLDVFSTFRSFMLVKEKTAECEGLYFQL